MDGYLRKDAYRSLATDVEPRSGDEGGFLTELDPGAGDDPRRGGGGGGSRFDALQTLLDDMVGRRWRGGMGRGGDLSTCMAGESTRDGV